MRLQILLFCALLAAFAASATYADEQPRTIHVFVALCDNQNQGIVPVPPKLGNGDDPAHNLYWGAAFGVRTYFSRSPDWTLVSVERSLNEFVLERVVFRHRSGRTYLIADAYRGSQIKQTVMDFLEAASGANQKKLNVKALANVTLNVNGAADLLVYIGHNGLMDFDLQRYPARASSAKRETIILACASKAYFREAMRSAGVLPLLWTTGLMAPEAYTLKGALDGWIAGEEPEQIRERAALAYARYQKCSLRAARNLLQTGW